MKRASAPGRSGVLTLCVAILILGFLSACGRGTAADTNSQNNGSQNSAPPTVTMGASVNSVVAGGSFSLTVSASNATQIVISDNCDSSTYTLPGSGGTQSVKAPSTQGQCIYTATASGGSQTATASVTVSVLNSTATTVGITASPTIVASGQPVNLTITVTNANSVAITDNIDNNVIPVSTAGGTVPTPPLTQTETFTVTATGANNQQATAQVIVTVLSVSITASPTTIADGGSSVLTVTAANANQVVVTDNVDSQTYTLPGSGGSPSVKPTATTIYTATATNGSVTATATVTIVVSAADETQIKHVIFLMQENRTFDTYFGMLNPYRAQTIDSSTGKAWNIGDDGNEYDVDGLADPTGKMYTNFTNTDDEGDPPFSLFKFKTVCVDDMSSDWLASYGDVHKNWPWPVGFSVQMNGFVHTAEDYGKACIASNGKTCSGNITDLTGQRAMGYYDQGFLNYYYYMASQFALSDRWFSPVASKTISNRLATMTGGTTQGLVKDPFSDDNLTNQLSIPTIFSKLTNAGVSWKIYYGTTNGGCSETDGDCGGLTGLALYPSITFADFTDSYNYLYVPATKGVCNNGNAFIVSSGTDPAINDPSNAFCIDPTHIAPVSQWFVDVANDTLPSFAFVEPAYGQNDEHPGSGQSILVGQQQVANMASKLMATASNPGGTPWMDSVFFVSYDEGGGPFDHVPPVPGHTNDFTSATLGITTDISSIAVHPDVNPQNDSLEFLPCPAPIDPTTSAQTPTLHCDLLSYGTYDDPGYLSNDAPAIEGFGAMLGFRLPNMVISPFAKRHFVSHVPMDHTAILKFVEDRFIGDHTYLTKRDAAQPDLADPVTGFFDFINVPWATPPTGTATPPPTPVQPSKATCTPASM